MPAPPVPQQWQKLTTPTGAGVLPILDVCGPALVALGSFPMGPAAVAQTSIDHGATWQDSPLARGDP